MSFPTTIWHFTRDIEQVTESSVINYLPCKMSDSCWEIHLLKWALSNLLNVSCKMSDSCREIHLLTWALGNLLNVPCKMSDSCRERHLLTWALGNLLNVPTNALLIDWLLFYANFSNILAISWHSNVLL
jgi:hypothetical protein